MITRQYDSIGSLVLTVLALGLLVTSAGPVEAAPCANNGGVIKDLILRTAADSCTIPMGAKLQYGNVHVLGGATLEFTDDADATDKNTVVWATNIVVENGGTLKAGTPQAPIGTNGGTVTIKLYGPPQPGGFGEGAGGKGVVCQSDPVTRNIKGADLTFRTCGAPADVWFSNVDCDKNGHCKPKPKDQVTKNADLDDYFYAYHPLAHDSAEHEAYFGYKVLGVGYGGTLELYGKKGGCHTALGDKNCSQASHTGRSWVRLKETVHRDAKQLKVEVPEGLDAANYAGLNWSNGDFIVLTTTDYLPGHSELLRVDKVQGDTIFLLDPVQWTHYGERAPLNEANHPGISRIGLNTELTTKGPELRAAVGLLTRSIRIVSGGSAVNTELPSEAVCQTRTDGPNTNECYFGGHTVFRQGAKTVQIQGVEFYQLGQGGRIAHYPAHFHHARKTHHPGKPELDTFVVDSSMWDSMTRWLVLHGTQDVTVARNVGYQSIGHGFYLEDGTEINNKLLANLGVYARAAVTGGTVKGESAKATQPHNPRRVPGILISNTPTVPYRSDADQPTVFWIMNGWNDFQYNHAAGAGTCGLCYWFLPSYISTGSRDLRWESYASMQSSAARAGTVPLKSFVGNSCTSAMTSFNTVGETNICLGVASGSASARFEPVPNPLAAPSGNLDYFPGITGGYRQATLGDVDFSGAPLKLCGPNNPSNPNDDLHDCSAKPSICSDGTPGACTITTLDRYTSSFNWAQTNFAALWLRNQWYLLSNSVITDVQNAGVNFVSGGGYTASDRITGNWQLVYKSVFIGQSQPESHVWALDGGPFNPKSRLSCDSLNDGDHCVSVKEGITFQMDNHSVGQRFLSFYDGPAVQDSNAYLKIKTRNLNKDNDDCKPETLFTPVGCNRNQKDATCFHNCRPVTVQEGEEKKTVTYTQCERVDSGDCLVKPPYIDSEGISRLASRWPSGRNLGLPKGCAEGKNCDCTPGQECPNEANAFCYLPNAAIAWKQPNGFYYPPAFRSRNLFFHDVEIRHYVIEPLFLPGTLTQDNVHTRADYCKWNSQTFRGFTAIDQQTVLLDEDGTLTGFTSSKVSIPANVLDKTTTVVNLDPFLAAPVQAVECQSDTTSRVAPYEYVTSVLYPACGENGCGPGWSHPCSNEQCYGVPIYRQDILPNFDTDHGKQPLTVKSIRMMGQDSVQRSGITSNHGTYFIDTAVKEATQKKGCPGGCSTTNVFAASETYYLFTIYAKPDTKQTFQIYVGTDASFNPNSSDHVWLAQADIKTKPPIFTSKIRAFTSDEAKYANGVLTVTLDHTKVSPNFTKAAEDNCAPKSYCTWTGTKCVRAGTTDDDSVCRWAVVDLDCPAGGCFAIGFKLPGGFVPDDVDHRPPAACVPNAAPWNLTLNEKPDGTCPQGQEPADFCK